METSSLTSNIVSDACFSVSNGMPSRIIGNLGAPLDISIAKVGEDIDSDWDSDAVEEGSKSFGVVSDDPLTTGIVLEMTQ